MQSEAFGPHGKSQEACTQSSFAEISHRSRGILHHISLRQGLEVDARSRHCGDW